MTAPGYEEVFQMDSMGSRRHLEEEEGRLLLQQIIASCCKCIHIRSKKNCSGLVMVVHIEIIHVIPVSI